MAGTTRAGGGGVFFRASSIHIYAEPDAFPNDPPEGGLEHDVITDVKGDEVINRIGKQGHLSSVGFGIMDQWLERELPQHIDRFSGLNIPQHKATLADYEIAVPDWGIALLAAVPSAVAVSRHRKRKGRIKNGLCLNCGYDLRASSGRCPECGAIER